MPKIVINEIDNTSPGVVSEDTDVVYIPGFVNIDRNINENLYQPNDLGVVDEASEYIGLKVNEPTLFTSVSQFESLCGKEPAYFKGNQLYSSLIGITADGSLTGFADNAVPYHDIMFEDGVADPSYVMAKELLSAGLPVLYQRVNADTYVEIFTKTKDDNNDQPSNWNDRTINELNYQVQQDAYSDIVVASAPLMFTKQNGSVFDSEADYYVRLSINVPEGEPDAGRTTIAFAKILNPTNIPLTTVVENGTAISTISPEGYTNTDGTKVPAFYTKDSNDVQYYNKSKILFSDVSPAYLPSKYYIKQGETSYVLVTSNTVPSDWGTPNLYYKDAKGSQVVTFTSQTSPMWSSSTYYKPTFTALSEKPEDWTTANYKYYSKNGSENIYSAINSTQTDFVQNQYYEITNDTVIGEATVPEDFIIGATEYYIREGNNPQYIFTQVNITQGFCPQFSNISEETSVLQLKSADENGIQTYSIVNTEPTDWGSGDYYVIGTLDLNDSGNITVSNTDPIQPIKTTLSDTIQVDGFVIHSSTPEEQEEAYYLPYSWVIGFKQCLLKTVTYENVSADAQWNPDNTYRLVSDGINIKTMYDALSTLYATSDTGLADKGNYSLKYLTSGGYPVYEYTNNSLVTMMMDLAEKRGDCVAFIDHTNNPNREQNIDLPGSLYNTVKNDMTFQTGGEYATMFTPWANYNRTTIDTDIQGRQSENYISSIDMPGSYAYFLGLADSITVNPNWLAIAGVARGLVQNLSTIGMLNTIPNGTADAMEPRNGIAINPITNIRPYGFTIWGNRTLKNNATEGNLTATSFLNIRNLVSDIKKEIYRTARKLTFEQNSDILWVNFKAELTPLLDRMLHGYGISNYKLQIDTENEHYGERATMCVKVIISPIEAVEDFYVTVVMVDNADTSISES